MNFNAWRWLTSLCCALPILASVCSLFTSFHNLDAPTFPTLSSSMNRAAALKADAPSRADMATPPPCQVEEVKTESIMSIYLLPPLLLVGGMIFFYSHMLTVFQESLKTDPYVDPFKEVSWIAPVAFSIIYLSFLYFGKMFMRTREQAFEMKHFIVTYNAYQCILNLWCVLGVIHEVSTNAIFVGAWGNTPESSAAGFRISFLVWVHYNNKYVELLDSVFMVLKKKDKQLSFLHCYHHIMVILLKCDTDKFIT